MPPRRPRLVAAWPRALALLAALPGLAAAEAAVQVPVQVQASEPRAFGYQVGDRIERQVALLAPAGWVLDEASLPRPGGRGQALELRRVEHASSAEAGGRRHRITLQYQIFLAPASVRTLETPPLRLRVTGPGRTEELRIEPWPVTVAPLVQPEAPSRRGLGELQPDRLPEGIALAPIERRLGLLAAAAAGVALAMAALWFGPLWRAARDRPFAAAWRRLRHLPDDAPDAQWRVACVQLHQALDRSAGEVLFEARLDAFLARRPAFAPLREDLLRFLRTTRAEFYGQAPRSGGDAAWLRGLLRRCRDAERGLA